MTTHAQSPTWFGTVASPGGELGLTTGLGLLIIAATALSVWFPAVSAWLFIGTALAAIGWYTRAMRRYRHARRTPHD